MRRRLLNAIISPDLLAHFTARRLPTATFGIAAKSPTEISPKTRASVISSAYRERISINKLCLSANYTFRARCPRLRQSQSDSFTILGREFSSCYREKVQLSVRLVTRCFSENAVDRYSRVKASRRITRGESEKSKCGPRVRVSRELGDSLAPPFAAIAPRLTVRRRQTELYETGFAGAGRINNPGRSPGSLAAPFLFVAV